ncbi:MAG: DUF3426 domain-containing protein [Betaproteobacteria bacterium]|nr:MAG: DUF3426 domain-containing protein [Betaproteobacteria bacterium]
MAEEKFTRCPGCSTIFRVIPQQLALRAGQVRCGHCQTVFDGVASLVSLAPQLREAREEPEYDEIAQGPPTVTLRSAHALQLAPDDADQRVEPAIDEPFGTSGTSQALNAEQAYAARFSWQEKRERKTVLAWFYATAIPLLMLLFAAQALFHFRDAIAAHWPTAKPLLIRMCAVADCKVRPLQDVEHLSIEASDLQADPAHKGLLTLSAMIRNRAPYSVAYPHIDLTLTDTQDQIVVRRAIVPSEYLSGAVDTESGVPGNSELAVKLFIDASATTQAGYQVYLFYP